MKKTKASLNKKKSNNIKKIFLFAISGLVGLIIFSLVFLVGWIKYEIAHQCNIAQKQYEGDCVESLNSLLVDENQSYKSRNDAIWVLGRLADPRALPSLENYYTGIIPEREPLDQMISQYELKKAIKRTSNNK